MARPREFDRQEVLDRAMQLFWEKGFEATSIRDLVECMGIGRASMYDTFGSKEALIFEVMDCYVARMKDKVLLALDAPGPARQVIRNLFLGLVDRVQNDHTKSCLITKSALMASRGNGEIMDRVCGFMDRVEEAFHQVLVRGLEQGDVRRDKDLRALARFFVNSMQGISVTACMRKPRALMDVVETTLSVLD